MKIYKSKIRELQFKIPVDLIAEEDNNIISFFNAEQGLGSLQFSIFQVPEPESIILRDELGDLLDNRLDNEISIHDKYVETIHLDREENRYWKYWLFFKNELLFFASYNCQIQDKGKEDKLTNQIIYSVIN